MNRYIIPAMRITALATEQLLANSLTKDNSEGNQLTDPNDILVKDNARSYDVWSDDWSR